MVKRKNIEADRLKKRELWVERTMRLTGFGRKRVEELLSTPRTQSFRLNPLFTSSALATNNTQPEPKLSSSNTDSLYKVKSLGIKVEDIRWDGVVAAEGVVGYAYSQEGLEKLRDSELVTNGEIYIQNAASWLPVLALDPQEGETILDVCAAPGGKSSHIQALTGNQSRLICNDNSKPRLMKLQRNMERLGASASYTLCDASRISRQFEAETFDKILLDAPCSGEGLMTFDELKLFDSWSVAHIRRLSDLQKKILHESWQLLKPGGTLVYSTCTMAPEENESVIDYFLRKHPGASLESLDFAFDNKITALQQWNDKLFANDLSHCLRLLLGELTEAFFVAKLVK